MVNPFSRLENVHLRLIGVGKLQPFFLRIVSHTEPTEGAVQKLYTETGENLPPPLIWGSINT